MSRLPISDAGARAVRVYYAHDVEAFTQTVLDIEDEILRSPIEPDRLASAIDAHHSKHHQPGDLPYCGTGEPGHDISCAQSIAGEYARLGLRR